MLTVVASDRALARATPIGRWFVRVERVCVDDLLEGAPSTLSPEERARFDAMTAPQAAMLRRAAHVFKRRVAGERLGVAPETLCFPCTPPFVIVGTPLHVSLSHTDGAVAVALADAPVGIDIEPVQRREAPVRLATRYFAPSEAEAIRQAHDVALAFAWRWTAKEALMKATGSTLREALATPIPNGDAPPFTVEAVSSRITVLQPASGFVCSIAAYSPSPPNSAYLMSR